MPDVFLGLLTKLATAGAKAGVKRLLKRPLVVAAIDEAISATADEFGELEGVGDHLRHWCRSEDFVHLLKQFKDGTRAGQPEEAVTSFVRATGFYLGDRTRETASALLDAFARHVEAGLYKSDAGIQILAAREEVQHRETRSMLGTMLSANVEEDKALQRTRHRFAEKVAEIYGDLALRLMCGGDSVYHHQTLTDDVAKVAKLRTDNVDRIDGACQGLATDMLDRLGTMADVAENARSMLEHLRQAFGYALKPAMSSEFDAMIDALEAIVRLAPRHPAASYSDMKRRARIPRALADLHVFITQADALDASFRRLFLVATGHPCEEGSVRSQSQVTASIDWYRRYHAVLSRRWDAIADCATLADDTW